LIEALSPGKARDARSIHTDGSIPVFATEGS
jgi:hypothetical protein